jgi:hypothetical protein
MAIRWDEFPHKEIRLKIYARLGQNAVGRSAEDSLRHILRRRLGEQNTGDFRQFLPCTRLQRVFSSVKQNIGHADDETACAVASLKDLSSGHDSSEKLWSLNPIVKLRSSLPSSGKASDLIETTAANTDQGPRRRRNFRSGLRHPRGPRKVARVRGTITPAVNSCAKCATRSTIGPDGLSLWDHKRFVSRDRHQEGDSP